jgi:hypothetical protein
MNTDELISSLSKDLQPVKPVARAARRWFEFVICSVVAAGLTFLLFSIRSNLSDVIGTVEFSVSTVLLVLGWLALSYSITNSQVPIRAETNFWRLAILLTFAVAFVLLILSLSKNQWAEDVVTAGYSCSLDVLFLSLLPGAIGIVLLRRGASTSPSFQGLNLGISCALLSATWLQFSCPSVVPAHLLIWHLLVPFVLLSFAGLAVGKKILSW